MATTIDERVVEMRFDNKQFEEGTKTTLLSLEKLKQALHLDGATKGLEKVDKAANDVNLARIADGVDELSKRFSTLGIVGMQVIQNITNSLMNTLGKGINFVQDAIVSGGIKRAMNIENARFQLQALLQDEIRVQAIMDNANESVTGTAYAYDEAAKAASQFAASGIKEGEQMMEALMGVVGVAAMTNSEYEGVSRIFTTVAGNGRLMGDQLLQLSSRGLNAAATLASYFSKVNSGAIEASDNIKSAIRAITKSTTVSEGEIREWVSKGKISFDIFASAMNNAFGDSAKKANDTFTGAFSNMKAALARVGQGFISPLVAQNSQLVRLFNALKEQINNVKKALVFDEGIGNVNALSKQVTDSLLAIASAAADFVENADLTKPLQLFYYGVEIVKNSAKGLFSVLKPIGLAFRDTFLMFSPDDVLHLADAIESLTYKMKLSERASENVRKTFKGVFDITKLLFDVVIKLVKPFVSLVAPTEELAGGFLDVSGGVGEMLTKFSEWARQSPALQKAYEIYSKSIKGIGEGLHTAAISVRDFVNRVGDIPIVKSIIESLRITFQQLEEKAIPALEHLGEGLKWVRDNFRILVPDWVSDAINRVTESLSKLSVETVHFDLSSIRKGFESLAQSIKEFLGIAQGNDGLMTFLNNMKNFGERLKEGFSFDNIIDKVDRFKQFIGDFVKWFKETIGPVFEDFSFGGAVAAGGGIGIMYSLIKISKSLESITKPFDKFSGVIGAVTGTLKAYQQDLKADAILKISLAVGVFAGALILLSMVDTDRLSEAAFSLALVSGVILLGVSKLLEAMNKGKKLMDSASILSDSLRQISIGIKSAIKNFGRAQLIKSIGTTFKKVAEALLIVAITCVGLGLMYKKDKQALEDGMRLAGILAAVMAGTIGAMAIIGKIAGGYGEVQKAASGALMITLSLGIVVAALQKLFKMELPEDYEAKLDILKDIFMMLALLSATVGVASKYASGKISTGSILALTAMLYVSTMALDKLFKIDLPRDWESRFGILLGIYGALGLLVLALGKAGKDAGGALKATGTILAICAFTAVAVGSLIVLSIFPGDKLLKGAIALGAVLVALAASLYGAGQITNDKAYKAVIGMALTVGTITAALGILSMVPVEKLKKAGTAIGAMLLVMAVDFNAISKISGNGAWPAIVGMIATIITITGALVILAAQPWEGILAGGVALGAVLVAYGIAFKMISEADGIDLARITLFLAATMAVLPIGYTLQELSKQPWEGMLAAGAALSVTVLAFAGAFKIISTADGIDVAAIGIFLLATVALLPIAVAIGVLANNPWEGMLAASTAISEVLLAMAGVMAICSKVKMSAEQALSSIAILDAFIVDFTVVLIALGGLLSIPEVKSLMEGGVTAFEIMGDAIGGFAGHIIGGIGKGMSDALPAIGENLSKFTENASGFFKDLRSIDEGAMRGVKYLAETVLILTGASLLQGLTSWLGGGKDTLSKFGEELEKFGPHISKYAESVKDLDPVVVESSANAAKMLAEMAKTLPNSGGLAAKILGDNSLARFGLELMTFGPHIAQYAESVKNVKPASVEASANAAKILAEMASTIPNSGGLWGAIVGNNDLSKFGEELKAFGPHIAQYAEDVKDVRPAAVEASANAVRMLVNLADELPSMGGLFSGDSKFEAFGKEMVSFGKSISDYGASITSVSWILIGTAIKEIKNLLAVAEIAKGTDASSLTNFFNSLNNVGVDGVKNFVAAFTDASGSVGKAITTFISSAINSLKGNLPSFKNEGVKAVSSYLEGFKSQSGIGTGAVSTFISSLVTTLKNRSVSFQPEGVTAATKYLTGFKSQNGVGVTTITTFVTTLINVFKTKASLFQTEGLSAATKYLTGIRSQNTLATTVGSNFVNYTLRGISSAASSFTSTGRSLSTNFVNGIRQLNGTAQNAGSSLSGSARSGLNSGVGDWYSIGSNAGSGFVNGIRSQIDAARAAAEALANAAPRAAKSSLKIHSPSRVMEEVGDYTGLGFINQLLLYVAKAEQVGREIGEQTAEGATQGFQSFDHIGPVFSEEDFQIRPVVDLSNVEESANRTRELFNEALQLSAQKANILNDSFGYWKGAKEGKSSEPKAKDSNDQSTVKEFNLIQNNYSPKALSRIDIYRDTKTLFTKFKEVVENQ